MSKTQSLQDPFLNALRKEKIPVAIYLVNGIKLQGQVESFDQFVVLQGGSGESPLAALNSTSESFRSYR